MIKKYSHSSLSEVMEIWLKTNIESHNFIAKEYWIQMYPVVEKILPNAEIYLYIVDQKIIGFIGMNDHYIEGIFILPEYQSNGYGKKLLDYAKSLNSELELKVYSKNTKAVSFYIHEGFVFKDEDIDGDNNENELIMKWHLNRI